MNPTFTETQKFNKWWHYLLAGLPLLFAAGIYLGTWVDLMPMKGEQKKDAALITLAVSLLFTLLFFIWFFVLKLKTTIDETGISAHFKGIPFCNKKFTWDEIQSIQVIEYSPLMDYGGWGVRIGFNGWCYNVSGKIGIKLTRANGKPFLIGTQQKEEAEKIINHYFKK